MRPLRSWLFVLPLVVAGCSSASRHLVEWKKHAYRTDARLSQHTLSASGHEVVYLDRGAERGAGETVVLIHGFGGDKDNWTFFARFIPDSYRVIAVDLPGFGESTRDPAAHYDVRAQSLRLLAILDALGLKDVHLAGNSMGGNIAARLAIDHPERVRSLTLIDSAGVVSPQPSEFARALAAGQNPLLVSSPEDFDRLLSTMFVTPPPIPGFIKRYFADRAYQNRAFNQKIFDDITHAPDRLEGALAQIKAPTLIVWGDQDRIIDVSAAGVFQNGIAGARTVLLHDCGHAPMIERPEETAEKTLAFWNALPARK